MTIQTRQRKSHGSIHLLMLLKVITFYDSSNKSNICLNTKAKMMLESQLNYFNNTSMPNTLFNNQKCASLAVLEQYVFLQ